MTKLEELIKKIIDTPEINYLIEQTVIDYSNSLSTEDAKYLDEYGDGFSYSSRMRIIPYDVIDKAHISNLTSYLINKVARKSGNGLIMYADHTHKRVYKVTRIEAELMYIDRALFNCVYDRISNDKYQFWISEGYKEVNVGFDYEYKYDQDILSGRYNKCTADSNHQIY